MSSTVPPDVTISFTVYFLMVTVRYVNIRTVIIKKTGILLYFHGHDITEHRRTTPSGRGRSLSERFISSADALWWQPGGQQVRGSRTEIIAYRLSHVHAADRHWRVLSYGPETFPGEGDPAGTNGEHDGRLSKHIRVRTGRRARSLRETFRTFVPDSDADQ